MTRAPWTDGVVLRYGWFYGPGTSVALDPPGSQIELLGSLINYEGLGRDAALSIPTPDHYLPLLYVLAAQQKDERVRFPVAGVDGGSISMLTVQIG